MLNISLMKLVELPGRVVGAAPVIRGMADAIGFVDLLNTLLPWDAQQCRTSPGERILAMVLDILTGKSPLYRVQDSLAETDVPLLLGRDRTAADFTDDALGRALDKLSRAGPAAVFTAVAAQAYAREAIDLRTGHWDSTSRSLQGAYRSAEKDAVPASSKPEETTSDSDAASPPPRALPRRGHSKDHRPDLKQILLTVFVNGEGVLRFGSVASGNTSDKTLNRRMIDDLVAAFSPEELQTLLYVADSSLVTGPNRAALRDVPLRFVSRCPTTFAVTQAAKAAAWVQNSWTFLGRVAARREAADYWASEQQGLIDGVPYRLVVYRSSFLEKRKEKTLDRRIAAARTGAGPGRESLRTHRVRVSRGRGQGGAAVANPPRSSLVCRGDGHHRGSAAPLQRPAGPPSQSGDAVRGQGMARHRDDGGDGYRPATTRVGAPGDVRADCPREHDGMGCARVVAGI